MSRIRSIHPAQWTDEDFVSCSPLARLLALGIRNEADDNGIFPWKPLQLKMRILPADNVDVSALLDELLLHKIVFRYEVGDSYGAVRNFHRFQCPRKPSSSYPVPTSPPLEGYEFPYQCGTGTEPVRNRCGTGTGIGGERRGEERKGKERKGEETESCAEADKAAPAPPAVQEELLDDPVVMTFTCTGPVKTWDLHESKICEYEQTYDTLDVFADLKRAWQWIQDNQENRKTAKGMPAFLGRWLNRSANGFGAKKPGKAEEPVDPYGPTMTREEQLRKMIDHHDVFFEDNEHKARILEDCRRELAEIEGSKR